MEFEDWVKRYENEAEKLTISNGYQCHFKPDKGFFYWKVSGDTFEVDHTCTNDAQWAYATALEMAIARLCRLLRTATFRNPAAYMRMFKGRLNLTLSGIRKNGKFYWTFEREVI